MANKIKHTDLFSANDRKALKEMQKEIKVTLKHLDKLEKAFNKFNGK